MTFTLILILNLVFDVAILGLLALVMSRPAKLTPHSYEAFERVPAARRAARERAHGRGERVASLQPAFD
jgi:hypothetical protein